MATLEDIKIGKYKQFEGPVFWGSIPVTATGDDEGSKNLLVTVTTEGAKWDAGQCYDACILTLGGIQFCEKFFLCSSLLGAIAARDPDLLTLLQEELALYDASFTKGRFWHKGKEVKTDADKRNLYFAGSSGLRGQWTDEQWNQASRILVACVNTLAQPEAIDVQRAHTVPRLKTYVHKEAYKVFFGGGEASEGLIGAARAIMISYSANNPTLAYEAYLRTMKGSPDPIWSLDWCIRLFEELAFGSGVVIYPGRYDKIRPVVEKLFGVNLPDYASQLKDWKAKMGSKEDETPSLSTSSEIQEALIALGYDLGPAGADGKVGKKTTEAIMEFQKTRGLVVDGRFGPKTRSELLKALSSLPS